MGRAVRFDPGLIAVKFQSWRKRAGSQTVRRPRVDTTHSVTHGVSGKNLTDFLMVFFSAVQQLQRDIINVDLAAGWRVAGDAHHEKRVSPHFPGFDFQVESDFHELIIRQA